MPSLTSALHSALVKSVCIGTCCALVCHSPCHQVAKVRKVRAALQKLNCKDIGMKAFRVAPFATRDDVKTQLLDFFDKGAEADCWPVCGGMLGFGRMLSEVSCQLLSQPL